MGDEPLFLEEDVRGDLVDPVVGEVELDEAGEEGEDLGLHRLNLVVGEVKDAQRSQLLNTGKRT
jgi:hypothetical protein